MQKNPADPLDDPRFKPPGFLEKFGEAFLNARRPLDCAQIEVSSRCSGRCLYCPHTTGLDTWPEEIMVAETFARLWPLLRRSQRAHLQGWGEPLLHPRFFDFARFARKAGCQVSTTSCGLIMTDKTVANILASDMDMLAFSLAGTDEASNSARAHVPFNKVRDNVRKLAEAKNGKEGPAIVIAYILLADRMDAVKNLPALLEEWGADSAMVSTLDYLAAPSHRSLAFMPEDHDKIAKARKLLVEAAREAEQRGRSIHFALPGPKVAVNAGGCRENADRTIYIDCQGQISPCVYLNVPAMPNEKRRVFGKADSDDVWAVWTQEPYARFRQALLKDQPDPACADCPKRHEIQEL